jgi:hypothetical protein
VTEQTFLEARGIAKPEIAPHAGPRYAQRLVEMGCHVHPLKLGSKAPATSSGLKDAKPDASDVTGNYGVATGRSGLVVVDLDDYVSGNAVEQFIKDFGLTPTFSITTGSGGRSWWYLAPEGSNFSTSLNFAGYQGVDIKAGESYALGPGCKLHADSIKKGSGGDGDYAFNTDGPKTFQPLPTKLATKLAEAAAPKVRSVEATPLQNVKPEWVKATLDGIAADLRAAQDWPENYSEPSPTGQQRGWDKLCADKAFDLAGMAYDGMISMEEAHQIYVANAPSDGGFDPKSKWAAQQAAAQSKPEMRKRPKDRPEDMDLMEGVPDRSQGKAPGGDEPLEEPKGKPRYELTNGPGDAQWLLDQLGTGALSGFFTRSGQLVYTARVDEGGYIPPLDDRDQNGPATIQPAGWEKVAAKVDHLYDVFEVKTNEETGKKFRNRAYFPDRAAKRALNNADVAFGIRQLHGVTHTPIVRRDGSILATPGYDDNTGLLYLPDVEVDIPDDQDILTAVPESLARVRAMIGEFSWAGEDDEANYLGLLLTPLLRELCPPPYKLAAIGAHQPGSGKSLLARIMREVHGGVFRADLPPSEEEVGKSIAGILTQTTAPVVQFDNVTGTLRSTILTALLTSAVYSGRILGSTNSVTMTNDRLWTITGNNLALGGDLSRRTIWVTIDPGVPNPEARTDFKLNLPEYVATHRGEILSDLLILIRGWVLAGSPSEPASSSDDYANWTQTVRGILVHAGMPGSFDGTKVEQVNEDDAEWAGFLRVAWELTKERRHWTVGDLLAMGDTTPETYVRIQGALPERLHEKAVKLNLRAVNKSLGRLATQMAGRHVGGFVLKQQGQYNGTKRWRVERYADHGA